MEAVSLFEAHNKIQFYSWSDQRCCLPKGATQATLRRFARPILKPATMLIFEEVIGPRHRTDRRCRSGAPLRRAA